MNVSKAIELALATVIRDHADLEPSVTIRTWQDLTLDGTWNSDLDRTFPMIEVRAAPPRTNENQSNLSVEAAILIGTMTADDKNHQQISDIYEKTQDVIDNLFSGFRQQSNNDEYQTFTSVMTANVAATKFIFGGFTYGDPQVPFEDRGANMIGIALVTHYARTDF